MQIALGVDIGLDAHADHGVRIFDLTALATRRRLFDPFNVVHALRDFTPDSVLTVQEAGVVQADKELAVTGIRLICTGHTDRAATEVFLGEFRAELFAGTAGARSGGVTGLRHEAIHDTVEHDAVIKPFTDQFLDSGNMVRCKVGAQIDADFTPFKLNDHSVFGVVGHGTSFFS